MNVYTVIFQKINLNLNFSNIVNNELSKYKT